MTLMAKRGELFGIRLACDHGFQDAPSACAHDVRDHRTQFDVRLLQNRLDALYVLHNLARQLLPRPGQIAQLLDRRRRDKAGSDKTCRSRSEKCSCSPSLRGRLRCPGGAWGWAMAKDGELHRVLHQARGRREALGRNATGARIVAPHCVVDSARGLRDQVELVRGREFDVAVGVAEQLDEFRLARLHDDERHGPPGHHGSNASSPWIVRDINRPARRLTLRSPPALLHLPFDAGDLAVEPSEVLLPLRVVRRDGDERSHGFMLGMAFKANVDDTRASLSYKFKKALASLTQAVLTRIRSTARSSAGTNARWETACPQGAPPTNPRPESAGRSDIGNRHVADRVARFLTDHHLLGPVDRFDQPLGMLDRAQFLAFAGDDEVRYMDFLSPWPSQAMP
jgi:hypothetical protein